MREIDIYTYPKKYRESQLENEEMRAQVTIELKEDLKERVLTMVFGNEKLELLK